jgi:hypothetical protein
MRRKVYTGLGLAALASLAFHSSAARAGVVFAPLQTNLTALGPISNVLGTESESTDPTDPSNPSKSNYQTTGSGVGDPNELSDAAGSATPGDQAIVVHYQTTDFPATSFFDVFVELSIPPGPLGSAQIGLTNPTANGQTVSNPGFLLSPTEIPLDNLNESDFPNSMFTPLPSLSETIPSAGSESTSVALPEPAALGFLAVGTAFMFRRRKR